ncbi:MAG TPA: hypothetical protein VJJ48_01540 [Candidatus Paceibacterota bacterium]
MPALTAPVVPELVPEVEIKVVKSEDYFPTTDSKNVEKFIEDYFADIPVMQKIAYCESRNRHFDKNGLVLRGEKTSLDRGVMQINLYFHGETAKKMGLDLHQIDDNVAYARYLYQKQGAKPWLSSSACWSKLPDREIAKK